MRSIQQILYEVIPPADYIHRNGFNNIPIINELLDVEKQQLEYELIKKLKEEIKNKSPDTLIVDTLAYLKSVDSLPVLYQMLNNIKDNTIKLNIATSIYEINQDVEMINESINSFNEIENIKNPYYVYSITDAFYYLAKFKNEKTNEIIKKYINHSEYLIAYNAKEALKLNL